MHPLPVASIFELVRSISGAQIPILGAVIVLLSKLMPSKASK
jgi:hypothetical protein